MHTFEISNLIEKLEGSDIHTRQRARSLLVNAGSNAVPPLIEMLHSKNQRDRLEAVKLLGRIGDKPAADALVEALYDESIGVHWAASEALIELGGGAILPLLEGLKIHFDSARFRQGAYHILHMFEQMGQLEPHIREVLNALRGIGSFASVPWAAERAIQALTVNKQNKRSV